MFVDNCSTNWGLWVREPSEQVKSHRSCQQGNGLNRGGIELNRCDTDRDHLALSAGNGADHTSPIALAARGSVQPGFNEVALGMRAITGVARPAAAQTIGDLWDTIRGALQAFTPSECANYFTAAGYQPDSFGFCSTEYSTYLSVFTMASKRRSF
jgi:hypothetical protein